MPSSLFGNAPQMPASGANNFLGMIQAFEQFKNSMRGKNPQAMVENLLKSGKMTQAQFDQLKQQASALQSILK